jgi:hypothetical protein
MSVIYNRVTMECSVENCTLPARTAGFCPAHYRRTQLGLDLTAPVRTYLRNATSEERLRIYAPPGAPDECWNWTRALTRGYGAMYDVEMGRNRPAHDIAWELDNNRKLPKGMVIRHTCDEPKCCNPAHLLLGTHADNVADKVARGRQLKGAKVGAGTFGKLNDDAIRKIRGLYSTGLWTQRAIAREFDISQSNVSAIVLRQLWGHVE